VDIYSLIKKDHQEVASLFRRLKASEGFSETFEQLFAQLREDLELHAHAEERVLYSALKEAEGAQELVEEALDDHELVQNLLDANRIERGEMKLNLAPTDLNALVASVAETQRPRAEAKQQSLKVEHAETPANVLADAGITSQVLENLVSNAVKYSPPGKNIFVRLKKEAGTVRCEVQDEGPGLSAEDQKKLFGKFARLSAKPTGGEHATGLGLSIVKRMVEAMNGKVWCESEPGKGAKFIVTLPAT